MKAFVLVFITLSCLSFFLLHVAVVRFYWRHLKVKTSPQNLIVKLAVYSNVILFGLIYPFAFFKIQDVSDPLIPMIYCFLVFNAFCFSYFVVFQLSETGRRIRMLRNLSENPGFDMAQTLKDYSINNMVTVRVGRLEKMGQIEKKLDGKYSIAGKFLLRGAKFLRLISLIVVGNKNRIDL